MSKARDISDSAAVINFLDGSTSNIQTQLDNISVTSGSLTKTFAADETATVTLSGNVIAPVVTATKEVAQTGVTNNKWDAAAGSYTLENSATATTIDFGAYEVTSASYVTNFSVTSQTGSPTSLSFNPTGTSMYVLDDAGNDINQYNLNTAFDVSTAQNYNNFSVASQETTPSGFAWNADGSKFFVTGTVSGAVNEYACSVAYNVTTASYTQNFSVSSQDGTPHGLAFNTDGTRMFMLGNNNNAVFEYQLTTGFDVSTASYTDSFSVASQETSCFGITFKPDGKSMYITGYSSGQIHVYTLTSAFDISTASYASQVFSTATWDTLPSSTQFNADGTKMFVLTYQLKQVLEFNIPSALALGTGSWSSSDVGKKLYLNGGSVVLTATSGAYTVVDTLSSLNQVASGDWTMYAAEYDSTADVLKPSGVAGAGFDLSVAAYTGDTYAANILHSIAFNNDGTKMYNLQSNLSSIGNINEYTLTTPYLPSSATYVTGFSVMSQDDRPTGICFSADGTKLFMVGHQTDDMFLYNLSTAWDLSTQSYSGSTFDFTSTTGIPTGITWNADGTKLYLAEQQYCYVYQFNASTAFDITTLSSSTAFGPTTAYETQLEGVAISTDGTKLFVTGGSSDKVHEYSLPTAFSLTGATYVQAFDVSGQTNVPTDVHFTPDGSDMYVTSSSQGIWQYKTQSVSTATGYQPAIASTIDSTYWTDINSMTATNAVGDGNVFYALSADNKTSWNILDNSSGVRKIVKNNSGTYQVNTNGTYGSETWANAATNTEVAALREAMTSAIAVSGQYDVSTATLVDYFSIISQDNAPYGFCFSATGHKLYFSGTQQKAIFECSLTTNFDVSTASYTANYGVVAQETMPADVQFNSDGTKMFVLGDTGNDVGEYALSTAWSVVSATFTHAFSIATYEASPWGLTFNADGTKMFTIGIVGNVVEWALSTGFDVSTASYTQYFATSGQLTYASGVEFNSDGTKMFVIDNGGQDVLTYTLTTGFDVSTASFTSRFDVNRGGLAKVRFNTDGTKMFLGNYSYADVGEYTVGTTDYVNQMTSTELAAINDASQITLGSALDFATILYYASGSTTPTYSGTAINYDANVINQGAILGTDYTYDAPAQNKVRITSVNAANLKIRVV